MIRPIPKYNPARQKLSFPIYGQFGYDEPVGRKHIRNKLSAIHKIIFNEEVEPINRDVYNQVKLNRNRSFLQEYRQMSSSMDLSIKQYSEDSSIYEDSRKNKYKILYKEGSNPQNLAKSNAEMGYNIIQNQYSERNNPSKSRIYKRQDSLDSRLNPYTPYQKHDFKREISLKSNCSSYNTNQQTNKSISKESMSELNRQLSQRYNIDSTTQHRQLNPIFLNSIL